MASDSEPTVILTDPLEERLRAQVAREGERTVALRSAALLTGGYEGESFLLVVGGEHADGVLKGAPSLYWPELWGARALLYVWDDEAADAVVAGLANSSWRVREMCARVCTERVLGGQKKLARLTTDEHPRVRSAGARALLAVATAGIRSGRDEKGEFASSVEQTLTAMLRDPDRDVKRAAQQAIDSLRSARA
ncbi:HEAT repeat domain-containing protein [Rathayibacter sp. ZW T2_19]|uniref:HEAT repeat domain-containing protein n=1 Tax=Rathayibacter rubneri TaxID=2950106 RepID=A0A9X2DZT1_9MICO|nr:HEAT repeat domain-containing protein [Rathayibacter rubneri]MCM6764280.1 HEAT repeat domain-containing protein [Rathayibacter rubneri]